MLIDGPSLPEASRFGRPPQSIEVVKELGRLVVGQHSLDEILGRSAQLTKSVVPGADAASVTLLTKGSRHSAASTDPAAQKFEEAQYDAESGPCLHAALTGQTVVVPDLEQSSRWPLAAQLAHGAGFASLLAVPLPLHNDTGGALNIYSQYTEAFGLDSLEVAEYVAGYAAAALTNANLYDAAVRLSEQLRTAMQSRAVIEQAKGILMGGRRCSADEAFALLAKLSQDTNRKLRDVAEALVAQAVPPSAE